MSQHDSARNVPQETLGLLQKHAIHHVCSPRWRKTSARTLDFEMMQPQRVPVHARSTVKLRRVCKARLLPLQFAMGVLGHPGTQTTVFTVTLGLSHGRINCE